jgi:hypothetical protein
LFSMPRKRPTLRCSLFSFRLTPLPCICVIVVVRCGEHTLSPSSWTDSLHPSTSEVAVTPPCTKHCASTTAGDVPVTSLLAMSLMRSQDHSSPSQSDASNTGIVPRHLHPRSHIALPKFICCMWWMVQTCECSDICCIHGPLALPNFVTFDRMRSRSRTTSSLKTCAAARAPR